MELLGRGFNCRMEKESIFGSSGIKFGDLLRLDFGKEYEEIKEIGKLVKDFVKRLYCFFSKRWISRNFKIQN